MIPRVIVLHRVRAAATIWAGTRGIILVGTLLLGGAPTLVLPPGASVLLVAFASALSWVDSRRRHETLFLKNLAVSPLFPILAGAVTTLALELMVPPVLAEVVTRGSG